jgi:hypothetical protein
MNTISYLSLWGKARTYNPPIKNIAVPSLIFIPENEKFIKPKMLINDTQTNRFIKINIIKDAHHPYNKKEIDEICEKTLPFLSK